MKDGDKKVSGSVVRWYDAGPLSLVGMVITGVLLVLLLWGQYQQPSTEDEEGAAPSSEEAASAPAEPESAPPPAEAEPPTDTASAPDAAPADLGGGAPSEPPPAADEPPMAPPPGAAPPPPPPPVVARMEPPPAAAPPPMASASSAGGGPYELKLTATAREVWVFVSADGGPRKERRLEKGQSATYKAERGYVVTVDDAAGVKASLNGQPLPAFGSGHAARKNITIPSSGS